MNYRHEFHAGNPADVMKHVLLVALVRALQRKPSAAFVLDSHAGRGEYELARSEMGDSLPRRPEHPNGIGRLLASDPAAPPAVLDYLELVRAFDHRRGGPRDAEALARYPGSPWILRQLARPQDRLAFCELQPDECAALRRSLGPANRRLVHAMDGYTALRAMLPPPERRGLVLVDPPYEEKDEVERVTAGLDQALRRFSTGIFAIWYPVSARIDPEPLWRHLAAVRPGPVWSGRLITQPDATGLRGSGLVVINPPWKFESTASAALAFLSQKLAGAEAAAVETRWIVPESPRATEP